MEARHAVLSALSLLFLAAISTAAGTTGAAPQLITGCDSLTPSAALAVPGDMISVALLALLVSFDVVALGYILSKVFANQRIAGWVSGEFWEMAKTAILIVGIFSTLAILGNIALALAPSSLSLQQPQSGGYSPSLTALAVGACSYLGTASVITTESTASGKGYPTIITSTSVSNAYVYDSFSYLISFSNGLGALKSSSIGLWVPIPPPPLPSPVVFTFGFQLSPYVNRMLETNFILVGQYASLINDMMNYIAVPTLMVMAVQYYLLPLVFVLGLLVTIPIGLILRAFPFVRGIGGMLIAIGIGMSLIYPALLVLLNYPVTQALQSSSLPTLSGSTCSGILCSFLSGLTGSYDALSSIDTVFPALNGLLNFSTYLLLQFMLFILDLAIAFPLVDNIAKMLGGSIRLQLGGKLKMR